MPASPFHHPFRIDPPTLTRAASAIGGGLLLDGSLGSNGVRYLEINPVTFTHAYLLLGSNPMRFTSDLSIYLAGVRMFFDRSNAQGGISIPSDANPDVRRRLSEDLGVGLASTFMVSVFGLSWDQISQIPQNARLSRKRPDFQGFDVSQRRFLYEAKGTTKLKTVEDALSKAMDQVKRYPEQADAKIAIVSYLSADDRFFPSASFIVDPPAMPDTVPPDADTSRELHFEKVLQFANLPQEAQIYTSILAKQLRDEQRAREQGYAEMGAAPAALSDYIERIRSIIRIPERRTMHFREAVYFGQYYVDPRTHLGLFLGADIQVLEKGARLEPPGATPKDELIEGETGSTSLFSDGTILHVGFRQK